MQREGFTMTTVWRRLACVLVALMAFAVMAPVALAATPGNDTFSGATPATIGFSEVIDTSEATTDDDDAQLNDSCGAPATDASVWYSLAGTDTGVIVDVSKSTYSAGVLVGVGTQGGLKTIACGPGTVGFFAGTGETYYILAIDDQFDGGGNGGELGIAFASAPPPPTLDLIVNTSGKVNTRTGIATISGLLTCTDADFVELYSDVSQRVGRFLIQGSGGTFQVGTCDGTAHPWSIDVYPYNGKFAGGKTATVTFSYACGLFECASGYVEQTVSLRGGSK
jgi:hypothetical protein